MIRYLKDRSYDPDEPPDGLGDCWRIAQSYACGLFRTLRSIQTLAIEDGEPWDAERTASIAAEYATGETDSADSDPAAVHRAVYLGAKMARERGVDAGPESIAYAEARLRSKIERDCVYNPIGEVYSAIQDHEFLRAQSGKKVVYLVRRRPAEPRQEGGAPKQNAKPSPDCMFQRVGFLDARPREWLVRGFIPRSEVCNPFGRPDSFKGVSAAQLAVHIAGGGDFLGMPLKQAPTAYFAGERVEQAKRRIKGHVQRLGLPSALPCYFGGRPIDLLSKPDLDFLIANVQAIEADAGAPLGFLVIDTQSRTMGGDENSTKDGAAYAKAIERIRSATDATLWIIAHTGHSEEAQDRPRGSSALLGAYDTFYRHKKTDERSGEIKITTDRDGLGGKEIQFAVELYDTGTVNEDGEPVLVPYLEAAAAPVRFAFKKGDEPSANKSPTRAESETLRALHKAIKKHGIVTPKGEGIPAGEVTVDEFEWRNAYFEIHRGRELATLRQGFSRTTKSLLAKNLVNEYGSRRWPSD